MEVHHLNRKRLPWTLGVISAALVIIATYAADNCTNGNCMVEVVPSKVAPRRARESFHRSAVLHPSKGSCDSSSGGGRSDGSSIGSDLPREKMSRGFAKSCEVYQSGFRGDRLYGQIHCTNVSKVVSGLSSSIIDYFVVRERSFGMNRTGFLHLIDRAKELFQAAIKGWESSEPSIEKFLIDTTAVLNQLKMSNDQIRMKIEELAAAIVNSSGSHIEPILPIFNNSEVPPVNVSKRSIHVPLVYNDPTKGRKSHSRQNSQNSRTLQHHRNRTFGGRAANRKLPKKVGMGRGAGNGRNPIPDVQYTRSEQKPEGKWWVGVQEVVGYFESTSIWATFFKELHQQLETDKVQLARIKGQLAFNEWSGSNNISENNLEEALNKILEEFKLPSVQNNLETLKNSVNGIKLNYFNELLRSDLKQEAFCIPSDQETLVAGSSYYFTSQLLDCISKTNQKVSTVLAVAANRMFFDEDVQQGANDSRGLPFDFVFVSPEWHILGGSRTVSVSGENGGNNQSIPGSPGFPGYPGKRFYGITEQIIGGELTIMANGGNGGPGVPGGVGEANGLCSILNGWRDNRGNDCALCLSPEVCLSDCWFHCPYYQDGEGFPRHGSHGGKGAEGGPRGLAEIIFLPFGEEKESENENQTVLPPNVKIVLKEGEAGALGPGGQGIVAKETDLTDKERRTLLLDKIEKYHFWAVDGRFWQWCLPYSLRHKQQENSASRGNDGGDIRVPQLPLPRLEFDPRLLARGMVEYYKISRLGSNSLTRNKIHQFTQSFHENNTLDAALLTVDLVTIFTHLEEQSALYFPHVPLHIYYSKIGKLAQQRLKNITENQFADDHRALSFLQSSVAAKRVSSSSPNDPIIVVDITEHLKGEQTFVQNILRATELSIQYRQVNTILEKFHKRIEALFEEAGYYTENILWPEIEAIRNHFDLYIAYLVAMIESLIQATHDAREELRRYQFILIAYTVVDVVFIGVGFAASILTMLNQAGYLLTYAAGIVRQLLPTEPGAPGGLPQLPQAVYGGNLAAAFRFRRNANQSLGAFLTQVKYTAAVMFQFKDAFEDGLKIAEYYYYIAENSTINPNQTRDEYPVKDNVKSFRTMLEVDDFITTARKNISEKIGQVKSKRSVRSTAEWISMDNGTDVAALNPFNQAGQHHRGKREFKFDLKDVIKDFPTEFGLNDAIQLSMTIIDTSSNLIEKLLGRYNQFIAIQKAIESIPAQVAALREYENRIKDGLVGDLDGLFGEFADLTSDIAGRSRTQLSLIKWRIQTTIRDAKLQLSEEYIKGLPIVPFFIRGLERLEEAYTVMVQIYENLADYQEQAYLADFTALVSQDPRYYLGKLSNEELENAVEKLRFILQGQIVVKRHQLTVSTFRLWRFPFVTPTLCEGYGREIGANMSDVRQLNLMLQTVDSYLDSMQSEVSQGVSSIVGTDEFILQTSWDIESGVPYFTWANESFYSEIKTVLSVEEKGKTESVQLYANPLQAPTDCGAYKFNKIILFFTKVNDLEELENDLHKALDAFDINLHHRGSNHYLFNDQLWTLPTGDANIKFSFRIRSNGQPQTTNGVYTKLLQGDFTLSPFGHWSLYFSKRAGAKFQSLKPWIGKVDMHLGGEGTCVTPQFLEKNKFIPPDCSTYGK